MHLTATSGVFVSLILAGLFGPAPSTADPSAASQDAPPPAIPEFRAVDAEIGLPYPLPDEPAVGLLDLDLDGYPELLMRGQAFQNTGSELRAWKHPPGESQSFGDFDNDGDLDLYATEITTDKKKPFRHWLLRCDGPTYTDIIHLSGLEHEQETRAHGFLDYDNDGKLDLFIAGTAAYSLVPGQKAFTDRLFRGDGSGKFKEVTKDAGLATDKARPASAVAFCDFDGDGFVDIYVGNGGREPNYLWRNLGDGTFRDIAREVGACGGPASTSDVDCLDFDNDGDFDLFLTNIVRNGAKETTDPRSALLRNELVPAGQLTFTDVTGDVVLAHASPAYYSSAAVCISAGWGDFDNNGWLDVFITESAEGGLHTPLAPARSSGPVEGGYSRMWLRTADGAKFVKVDTPANKLRLQDTWGAACGDFNLDGWLDLAVGSRAHAEKKAEWFDPAAQRAALLRNGGLPAQATGSSPAARPVDGPLSGPDPPRATRNGRNYLLVTAAAKDRPLAGAIIELTLGDKTKRRQVIDTAFSGYAIGNNQLHFGLRDQAVKTIAIIFPGGETVEHKSSQGWKNVALMVDASRGQRRKPQTVAAWK